MLETWLKPHGLFAGCLILTPFLWTGVVKYSHFVVLAVHELGWEFILFVIYNSSKDLTLKI